MKIIIYGAGAIGSVVGGYLRRAGHDVELIGRGEHIRVIQERGLKLVSPGGTQVIRVPAVTNPDRIKFKTDDVVFLCMKGQDTENALRDLRDSAGDIPVFCLQNGIRNEELAVSYFRRVYGVMIRIGAEYIVPGEATSRRDPPGWLIIGRYPRGKDELAETVGEKVRSSGFLVKLTDDVMPYKWGKLMANLGNAVDAITGGEGQEIEIINQAARQELIDCLKQAGIRWIAQEQISREWPETNIIRDSLKTRQHSSTWQSLTRQQGSAETEFLNGEVVRLGERLGRSVPVNATLNQITQEMAIRKELPGKFTARQLCLKLNLSCESTPE